ncbi:hypothetical protein BBJ28_00002901 [Nothophytophthora sp. Chile5]|nr:hypothetical protein BBJ28_00002901 [Nothophytophthora sp. Chile5]
MRILPLASNSESRQAEPAVVVGDAAGATTIAALPKHIEMEPNGASLACAPPPLGFDSDKLLALQQAIPTELQLLRLRLRFGLPKRVHLDQKFRVVVDLVDEMGQPSPIGLPPSDSLSLSVDAQLILKVEEESSSARKQQRHTKWTFMASLHQPTDAVAIPSDVSLIIQIQQSPPLPGDSSVAGAFRRPFQRFCRGSTWLNDQVLVLPLQVALQVVAAEAPFETSTVCQRVFCASLPRTSAGGEKPRLLVIEEHYGDAMGAHVWDASILLSFVLLEAGIASSESLNQHQTVVELGSGCGLFASVLTTFCSSQAEFTAIFTEKPECTARLQHNLQSMDAMVLPLEWGEPLPAILSSADVTVVFAADVLYNWAAHEALLTTLDGFTASHMQLLLAHKRRGHSSAAKMDALAAGAYDPATQCGVKTDTNECRWSHWHVEKLAALGRIDLFRVSRRAQ